MKLIAALLLSSLLTLCLSVQARDSRYVAAMEDSKWLMSSKTPIHCALEHDIPRFGKAVFSQSAGRKMQLELLYNRYLPENISVIFQIEPPVWKKNSDGVILASLEIRSRARKMSVPTGAAEQAFYGLEAGLQPSFYIYADGESDDATVVTLSTVRFRNAKTEFVDCVSGLYPDNFDDIKFAKLHFEFDDEFPTLKSEDNALEPMFNYLKVDNKVSQFIISGHADHMGKVCYNDTLSSRRAWYVYDLLIAKGVDPARISVNFFGESKPLVQGQTKQELALNRRVSVAIRR
ncbi:MAG: outer membrane protein OmpA-like peptidoglycan-associated protein [Gammaproteobacteria bacterium]|jgi:outer membrane protein OmpA-like peptidoglycan-associated protein